jgi:hypothetical protein
MKNTKAQRRLFMKGVTRSFVLFVMICFILFASALQISARAELTISDESGDKTLSPYFLVKSDAPLIDQLPGSGGMGGSTGSNTIAEKKSGPLITIGDITASGGLSKEVFRVVIEKHMDRLEKCYKAGASKGKVALVFTINADGTIKAIKTASDTLKNEIIAKCIINEIKKFVFPATVDGRETTATITFSVS